MGECRAIRLRVSLKSPADGRWFETEAEVDSGMTYNGSISRELAKKLGLKSSGTAGTETPQGEDQEAVAQCDLSISNFQLVQVPLLISDLPKVVIGLGIMRFFNVEISEGEILLEPLEQHPRAVTDNPLGQDFIPIRVGLRAAGRTGDDWIQVDAVVDTGLTASSLAIPSKLARRLGVRPTTTTSDVSLGDGSDKDFKVGYVDVTLAKLALRQQTAIFDDHHDRVVIGLPLLKHFDVLFTRGKPTLTPSQKPK